MLFVLENFRGSEAYCLEKKKINKKILMLPKFVVFQHSYILIILFLSEIQKSGLEFVYVIYKRDASKELEELRTVKFIHTA